MNGKKVELSIRGRIPGAEVPAEVRIKEGKVVSVSSVFSGPESLGSDQWWIAPALFDIQVNGFAGVDLNSRQVTPEDLMRIVKRLQEKGVALFHPTIITHSFEHMSAAIGSVARACRIPELAGAIPGLHVEGPYISPEEGARGAHPLEHIRVPNWDEFLRLQESAAGMIRLITLAPEVEGAIPFIEKLTAAGVVPSIGHTAAKAPHIEAAIRAGAQCSTHLGNGSHAVLPRHHNYVWEQLAADELWASFIVDGHHLPPSVVKCFLRAKGTARSILTSDAIAAAGMPPGPYRLGDIDVTVSPGYRVERVDSTGSGYLAGSALDLLQGVQNTLRFTDVSLAQALQMASANPAQLMGISNRIGKTEAGCEANLILFEWDPHTKSIDLKYTIHRGEVVYQSPDL